MNPDELVKGELYRTDMPNFSRYHGELVLYLGSESPPKYKHITNYCFLLKGRQRVVDRHFLKNVKELK